jgi:hypothetical protein
MVLDAVGPTGESATVSMVGALLEIVSVDEVTDAPLPEASLGVTMTETRSSFA